MVVDEGDGAAKVQVVDPPNDPPPSPSGFSSLGPPICNRPKGGAGPLVHPGAARGVRGGSTRFRPPQ